MSSVATAPSTIPSSRPVPLLPIEIERVFVALDLLEQRGHGRAAHELGGGGGVGRDVVACAARNPFSAAVRWNSSSR